MSQEGGSSFVWSGSWDVNGIGVTSSSSILITSGGGGRKSVNSKFAFLAASSANCTQSGSVRLVVGKVPQVLQEGGPLHCWTMRKELDVCQQKQGHKTLPPLLPEP